jgi:hypothetical protein
VNDCVVDVKKLFVWQRIAVFFLFQQLPTLGFTAPWCDTFPRTLIQHHTGFSEPLIQAGRPEE